MLRFFLQLASMLFLAIQCFGDGKIMYVHREKVNPKIPYQRALITYHDGVETMVLQSKYEVTPQEGYQEIAWIVPLPSVPEIASMPADKAETMFQLYSMGSPSNTFSINAELYKNKWWIPLLLSFVYYIYVGVTIPKDLDKLGEDVQRKHNNRIRTSRLFGVLGLGWAFFDGFLFNSLITVAYSGVEVVKAEKVGIHDVQVVRSDDSRAMVSWLEDNGFEYSPQDVQVFDRYIQDGWCFVAAKSKILPYNDGHVSSGLFAPLILKFASKKPVYPLALTSTGGHDTEILLYLISEMQYRCDERLKLRYVRGGNSSLWALENCSQFIEPHGFLDDIKLPYTYLHRFKGKMTSEQMKEDLVFEPVDTTKTYREFRVRW